MQAAGMQAYVDGNCVSDCNHREREWRETQQDETE